jgi:hypothetical protein
VVCCMLPLGTSIRCDQSKVKHEHMALCAAEAHGMLMVGFLIALRFLEESLPPALYPSITPLPPPIGDSSHTRYTCPNGCQQCEVGRRRGRVSTSVRWSKTEPLSGARYDMTSTGLLFSAIMLSCLPLAKYQKFLAPRTSNQEEGVQCPCDRAASCPSQTRLQPVAPSAPSSVRKPNPCSGGSN